MDHVTFSHAALEYAFEGMFWDSYLPNRRCSSLFDYNQRTLGGSISVVRDLLPNSVLLRTALGAMALRSAASTNDDPHSTKQQAMRLYASALQQTRKIITTDNKNGLELLSATRIFSFYEALYGSDWADKGEHYRNWSVHNSGDLALMVSKPPNYYRMGVAHRLFVDGRVNLALHALTTRKGSILGQPPWLNDPWEYHPKTSKDMLVDIILEVPSLYEGIDGLETKERFDSNSRQALQQAAYTTIDRLLQWGNRFACQVVSSQPDWQRLSRFTTEELTGVHLMTFYWATLIIAHDAYQKISNGEPHDLDIDTDDCCCKIIHCIPLFLHPSTGIFRQHLMPFPAVTAIRHLDSTQPSLLRPEREYIASISGAPELAGMRKFMSSLQPHLFTGVEDTGMEPER
ncbi:hypothetical protein PEBR_41128 [Penicillium brasilianum]|uniref:C6 finger domain protein n=1 Tax=Penicillium brasilianum TaxID=104259 RepID=A0A1S9R939_PENBI|nr:hypothetical protein PEBR_41128 [Penicillium brasilianum]